MRTCIPSHSLNISFSSQLNFFWPDPWVQQNLLSTFSSLQFSFFLILYLMLLTFLSVRFQCSAHNVQSIYGPEFRWLWRINHRNLKIDFVIVCKTQQRSAVWHKRRMKSLVCNWASNYLPQAGDRLFFIKRWRFCFARLGSSRLQPCSMLWLATSACPHL